jgi:hypothetical protein
MNDIAYLEIDEEVIINYHTSLIDNKFIHTKLEGKSEKQETVSKV